MEQVDERAGAYPQLTGGDVPVMQRGVATRHMTTSLIRRGCRLLPKNTARTDALEAVAGVASDKEGKAESERSRGMMHGSMYCRVLACDFDGTIADHGIHCRIAHHATSNNVEMTGSAPKFATGDGVARDASRSSVNGGA